MKNYAQGFSFYLPTKLVYEIGAIQSKLVDEIKMLGAASVLIVTDKGVVNAGLLHDVEATLNKAGIPYQIFDDVEPNPSTDTCYKSAEAAKSAKADILLAVGGGSPMDVAKATAILVTNGGNLDDYEGADKFAKNPIPFIAIPTTAGTGSEVTPYAVITIRKRNYKMTILSNRLLPQVAILDPMVVTSLPPHVAASTGIDAFVHAFESFINRVASPVTDAYGAEAMRLIGKYLRLFVANRQNKEAAAGMMIASNLAGVAFAIARLGNVHAMAHPLGGFFNVPHGVANAILLPHVAKFNLLADDGKYKRVAGFLGEDVSMMTDRDAAPVAVEAIETLCSDVGIPETLTEVGVTADKIPDMARDAMLSGNVLINPRSTRLEDIIALYTAAM
ncbi:MAG TPA: iron-containing alcohol dehydrogenase [Syntrophales bacterium]|nr:iron-containing alcohol dehydrogenase [Syntrophales bacterium]HPQ44508.1 iron-containing alcohol dehydrogenase [Syntrophales bacterium]